MNSNNKIKQVKSIVDSLSLEGLKIWAQYLWEIQYVKDKFNWSFSEEPFDKYLYKFYLRQDMVKDLWNQVSLNFSNKSSGRYIGDFVSTKYKGKNSWLEA